MTIIEAEHFVAEFVAKLYSEWKPEGFETDLWAEKLRPYEKDVAVWAIRAFAASKQGGYKKPKLHAVLELCKQHQQQQCGAKIDPDDTDPVLTYSLRNTDTEKVLEFFGRSKNRIPDRDSMMRQAERMRDRVSESNTYAGTWDIIIGEVYAEQIPF